MSKLENKVKELEQRISVLESALLEVAPHLLNPVKAGSKAYSDEELRDAFNKGMSAQQIADHFGVTRSSVYQRLETIEGGPLKFK